MIQIRIANGVYLIAHSYLRSMAALWPVVATHKLNTPHTLVPCVPRYSLLRPQRTSATNRPWRLAGPARGIKVARNEGFSRSRSYPYRSHNLALVRHHQLRGYEDRMCTYVNRLRLYPIYYAHPIINQYLHAHPEPVQLPWPIHY